MENERVWKYPPTVIASLFPPDREALWALSERVQAITEVVEDLKSEQEDCEETRELEYRLAVSLNLGEAEQKLGRLKEELKQLEVKLGLES